jgi:hypothetical protein
MVGAIDEYKRLIRVVTVSDQTKLFQMHIAIYLIVNIVWLALNFMGSIKIEPMWAIYFSPVGWSILIIVHYWFEVRGAENLCKMWEEKVEAMMK